MGDYAQKPPLGIMPQCFWLAHLECFPPSEDEIKDRKRELLAAIRRYKAAGLSPNPNWALEYSLYE